MCKGKNTENNSLISTCLNFSLFLLVALLLAVDGEESALQVCSVKEELPVRLPKGKTRQGCRGLVELVGQELCQPVAAVAL